MEEGARVTFRIPAGGPLEELLGRWSVVADDDGVGVELVAADDSGQAEPPSPGTVILSLESPQELADSPERLVAAIEEAPSEAPRLVVAIGTGDDFREHHARAAVAAARRSNRDLTVAVQRDG